jgi:MFS family permease
MADARVGLRGAPFSAWWALGVLFLLYVFSMIDRYVITMMVPSIKSSLSLSDTQMGLILGPAFALFYAVFGMPLGWAADKYPRRWVIFLGAVLFGLATATSAFAGTFGILFLTRMFVGIGEASLSPAAYSLMADKFPRNLLTTASSIYNTAAKVGVAASYAIGGVAIGFAARLHPHLPGRGALEPWQIVFLLIGMPAAVLALLVFTFREPPRTVVHRKAGVATETLVGFMKSERRLLVPMMIGFGLIALCSYSLTAWTPTYLTRKFGSTPESYGPVLGLISMAAALTLILKGMIVDWLYGRGMKDVHIRFFSWLLVGTLPVVAGMFFVSSPLFFMILYGFVQVVAMPIIVYMSAAIQLIAPGNLRGQLIAVYMFCLSVFGGGLGPIIVGALTDHVFGGEAKIGSSLAVVVWTTIPLALICLRLALKPLRMAMGEAEARLAEARLAEAALEPVAS